jgi:flagellar basal body-associated protein FliL
VTPGEMVVLLLLAVLFLAAMVGAMVLVFFRPWLILRREQDQYQEDLESEAPEPRESPESAGEASGDGDVPPDGQRRSWWRRYFGY